MSKVQIGSLSAGLTCRISPACRRNVQDCGKTGNESDFTENERLLSSSGGNFYRDLEWESQITHLSCNLRDPEGLCPAKNLAWPVSSPETGLLFRSSFYRFGATLSRFGIAIALLRFGDRKEAVSFISVFRSVSLFFRSTWLRLLPNWEKPSFCQERIFRSLGGVQGCYTWPCSWSSSCGRS